ncbi:MAG: protein serine/threonine phosphatase [Bacteroidetes bacterium]|nr:protein serine/threonine phosphatase [Bacteroidota bacterium]
MLMVISTDAQQTFMDSIAKSHHHTPLDILSGSGDDTIVCYKQAHRNMYFLVTGLIIIIAIGAIRLLLLNKRTTKMLKEQNEIIEEKNKSITDSINYAKRLQNAILPSREIVTNILPEHFILYQPKDIVSGDFYWVSHHDTKFMIAAVDCTGHGVPGALLSIVGHSAINQTVNELGITQPAKVLDSMNTLIKKILHQDKGSDIRDGMDMALCTFDKQTNTLEYAGANNPLYIVSDNKLTIIKGSKLTVGSLEETVIAPPENHSMQLKKGDCVYIFSDGFADQFGGKDNKKFKSSRMQELLLSVNTKTMPEQQTILSSTFASWKGSNEQVDDILLMGVRV